MHDVIITIKNYDIKENYHNENDAQFYIILETLKH